MKIISLEEGKKDEKKEHRTHYLPHYSSLGWSRGLGVTGVNCLVAILTLQGN